MQVFLVRMKVLLIFTAFVLLYSCVPSYNSVKFQESLGVDLVDPSANKETVLLFYNLMNLSTNHIIFGHQHSTMYGVKWLEGKNRSDVKDVTGSFPGLYGWDFDDFNWAIDEDGVRRLVIEAYERGGVNTFSWHYANPVTGKSFYDTTVAVKYLLPGGSHHEVYKKDLDKIAEFFGSLKDSSVNKIPIIFRPYHEFNGFWFWWGSHFCTPDEFKQLWRFTVDYLRNEKHLDNVLYAFSPDRMFYSEAEFLERYPGSEYVDIVGMDNYWDFLPDGDGLEWITKKLQLLTQIAKSKGKVAAFTETGLESIPDSTWWTQKLLKVVDRDGVEIAYIMVWRNDNHIHHYAPYLGHPSSADFIKFKENSKILFEDELPELYKLK